VNTFRFLRVFSLVVWLGGIIFFSFVVAPTVFRVLAPLASGPHFAGTIVNQALGRLHWIGLACGALFLLAAATLHKTFFRPEIYLVAMMLVLTATSQFGIMPRMDVLRLRLIEMEEPTARANFDRLHQLSVAAEGGVLLLGLLTLALVAGNRSNRPFRR
jgi:uncharacterized membrane protein